MSKSRHQQVTTHLRQLAVEAESISDDGSIITKAEALALLLWRYALGFEEVDPDDPAKRIRHRPQQWAVVLLYDRLEGKAVPASEDEDNVMTAADRVSELAKNAANAIAIEAIGDVPEPDVGE